MKKLIFLQLSETVADDRGISARIGRPWISGGDVPVDRLMWQAVCVMGRKLAGATSSSSSSSSSSNNRTCLPVIYFLYNKICLKSESHVQFSDVLNFYNV